MPKPVPPSASDAPAPTSLAEDVRRGLTATPKQLPARWLYDRLGSALFEAICALPWYPVTRAERTLFERHAAAIAEAAGPLEFVAELGPGSGEKLTMLLRAIQARSHRPAVHLVDVSRAALETATRTLAEAGIVDVSHTSADYADGIRSLPRFRRDAAGRVRRTRRRGRLGEQSLPVRNGATTVGGPGAAREMNAGRRVSGRALVAFLGSNIGNFHEPDAVRLLTDLGCALRSGDYVLLGADLVKPVAALRLAYDDPLGVTAAFNKNLLLRINRELSADFELDAFRHHVCWNEAHSRVEMHLVSTRRQAVAIPGAGCTIAFDEGDSIWTESSYKYTLASLDAMGQVAGLTLVERWTDDTAGFTLTMYQVPVGQA